jgi:F0F1-type ATP synthase membrane subunit a
MQMLVENGTSLVDFSAVDLSQVVPTITAAITATLSVCVTVILIKKAYGIFKRGLKGA